VSRVVETFTYSEEIMDECLDGVHHIASNNVGIQQDFGCGGLVLQVCHLYCDKNTLQLGRSCKVVFQAHGEVLGSSTEHCFRKG